MHKTQRRSWDTSVKHLVRLGCEDILSNDFPYPKVASLDGKESQKQSIPDATLTT